MMIIYEITATVRAELIESFEDYMTRQHIPDLMKTRYFAGSEMSRAAKGRYRMRYELVDQETLDEYLKTDASRLREDFVRHFPEGIEVSRENWDVLHRS